MLFYPDSAKGPTMVGLEEKIFRAKGLRWPENSILTLVFASTVRTSYAFFQQIHKHYIAFNSPKRIYF